MPNDDAIISAQNRVAAAEQLLLDKGIHPERFARWLCTVPVEGQDEVLDVALGKVPGMLGAVPNTREAELLQQVWMTADEVDAHQAKKWERGAQ